MKFWAAETQILNVVQVHLDDIDFEIPSIDVIKQSNSEEFSYDLDMGELGAGAHTIDFNAFYSLGKESALFSHDETKAYWILRWMKITASYGDPVAEALVGVGHAGAREKRRLEFFGQLLDRCRLKTSIFNNVSPVGYQNWVCAGAGKSGLMWSLTAMEKSANVSLYFSSSAHANRTRFNQLIERKPEIEKRFGGRLIWDFREERKQQYVKSPCPFGGMENEDKWASIQVDLVKRLIKLEAALRDEIRELI
jgi:hypothetical protein